MNFTKKNKIFIDAMSNDIKLKKLTKRWFLAIHKYEYGYHFRWLGRPIIQFPQDIIVFQELIWKTKPDLIIETGIARGGSLVFFASMLEIIGNGHVIGIEKRLRSHNEKTLLMHPMLKRIKILKGSSTEEKVFLTIKKISKNKKNIMIILDSDHNKEHVLRELELYSSLVSKGNYIIVCDTIMEEFPQGWFKKLGIDRPWNKKNNPKVAVRDFLKQNKRFRIDNEIEKKLLITTAPNGFLKCVKNR